MNDENETRPLLDESEDRPLLDDVTPVQWDPQAEASYEAAIEEISQKIAGLSEQIFDERQKDQPDQDRIDWLRKSQELWSDKSARLRLGADAQPEFNVPPPHTRSGERLSHHTTA